MEDGVEQANIREEVKCDLEQEETHLFFFNLSYTCILADFE